MTRFRGATWLFPVVLAAHIAEVAPGFGAWARRHGSSAYTQRDFVRINALGLAMTLAATALVATRRLPVFVYFATQLTQQALFNTVFHAGTTIVYREYSPGLVTAFGGFLPLWWYLTRLAGREGLLGRRRALAAAGIGGVIHSAAIAQQVYGRRPRWA